MVNPFNGKHYVGDTKDYYRRWSEHERRLASPYTKEFLSSLKVNKLTFFLLEKCTLKNLKKRAQYWMDQFPNKVNMCPSIDGTGLHISEETRRKMSIANTGRFHTSDAIEKIRKAKTGLKHNSETIEKCRQARLAWWAKKRNK